MKKETKILIPLFVTIFIDLLGVGIIIPVLAAIFFSPHSSILPEGTTYAKRALDLGLLVAVYPFCQFFGAPIIGAWSDKIGRKKMLILSLLGTALGYVLFAVGILLKSLPLLYVARALDGITGGNISVAQSSIADMSTPETRARNFGLIGMAFGFGFIIGPFVGGKLADSTLVSWFAPHIPFWFAAALTLVNVYLVVRYFIETNPHAKEGVKTSVVSHMVDGVLNLKKAWSIKKTRYLFAMAFFMMFGFSSFTQFYQVYLINRFGFTEHQIGNYFAYIGILVAIVQGGLVRIVSKKRSPEWVLSQMPLLLGVTFISMAAVHPYWYLYISPVLIALSNGLSQPTLVGLISSKSDAKLQGQMLGINQSINSLAQMIPPLLSAYILTIADSLPIIVAGIATFIAWFIFVSHKETEEPLVTQAQ